MYVCVCLCMYVYACEVLQEPEDGAEVVVSDLRVEVTHVEAVLGLRHVLTSHRIRNLSFKVQVEYGMRSAQKVGESSGISINIDN